MSPSRVPGIWALLLLLLSRAPPAQPSVDTSFRDCSRFLYKKQPPTGVHGRGLQWICQHYEGTPRYATLYDPAKRIPLYSAYTFKRSSGERSVGLPWMYEPQLSKASSTGNMLPFPQGEGEPQLQESQAVLADYADAVLYERGQLNPDEHQASPSDKAATYTLTNVVPQAKEFYQTQWAPFLDRVRQRLNNYCRGTPFVVAGVTTTGNTIRKDNLDRVAIPRYVWLAYCCPDFDPNAPYEIRYKLPSYAAYGLNELVSNSVTEVSSKRLEALIKREMPVDQDFQLFYDNCIPEV
ncbi:endonuclease domain-containing 1 protein-like [Megalops cyprinoides]|uniref:endonuclease domain-containing 1 protein-like n=1 Tax=Megalops cyprinoides TaxID=118141 RepID=UPI001864BDD7|nr:endonuclease domain-containing 1 protein-like [Megalops cyprinoides]